ncbi:OB-fold domain-containing protein [Aldersonia sp. NBC_00410]|uniref:Zn-ribbon domain-containing OB-fold protein n=1 Tax=Aldersonia sp. NBC_00410 TaxID=2975954 RepID=UPI002259C978|nr:OB-fold nucleic acid binding domain-containing protein [Aldersonia sp. NBC_00410]MCX5043343.1 OB-fold domain-containing protein [Aldersonia sp. NBC_00410]
MSFGNSTTAELPARTDQEKPLSAPLILDFDYTRSVGPVIGRFLTGLRDRRVVGIRGSDGRVFVPPQEYDPGTAAALDEFVDVSSVGTVKSWTWVRDPLPGQPFDRPFAWALIQLDGADTSILHAVDVASPHDINTGMRVRIKWAEETVGSIHDIACFVPGEDVESTPAATDSDPVTMLITPVHLEIDHSASYEESYYLRGLAEGKLLGGRSEANGKVYIPPRGANPTNGEPTTEQVELPDRGIVTTFCVVNVPFLGQRIKPPYIAAYVLLDGADIAFLHLILECDPAEVRMGMRVEAKWRPREEWGTKLENIEYFRPTGEPDAEYDTYKQHL